MKTIFVRKMNGLDDAELEKFQEAYKSCNGQLGPEATYPDTNFLVAESDEPLLFQPVQNCFVMGSLGYGAVTSLQLAQAMRQIVQILAWESRKLGRGDIYFVGGHPESDHFATQNGFELVDKPVYRLRLEYGKQHVETGSAALSAERSAGGAAAEAERNAGSGELQPIAVPDGQ